MRALDPFLAHPHIARVKGNVKSRGPRAEHHHAATLDDQARDRKRLLAGMLEYDVDIALAGDAPDRLAKFARFFDPGVVGRRIDRRHRPPTIKVLAIDDALGAKLHD